MLLGHRTRHCGGGSERRSRPRPGHHRDHPPQAGHRASPPGDLGPPDHRAPPLSVTLGDRLDSPVRASQRPAPSPRDLTTQQPPAAQPEEHSGQPGQRGPASSARPRPLTRRSPDHSAITETIGRSRLRHQISRPGNTHQGSPNNQRFPRASRASSLDSRRTVAVFIHDESGLDQCCAYGPCGPRPSGGRSPASRHPLGPAAPPPPSRPDPTPDDDSARCAGEDERPPWPGECRRPPRETSHSSRPGSHRRARPPRRQ